MCNLCDSMYRASEVLYREKISYNVTSWIEHTIEIDRNKLTYVRAELLALCSKNVSIWDYYTSDKTSVHLMFFRTKAKDETKCRK